MAIEALRERLAYWQRVLRLQDWDIVVEYVDQRDFENRTWLGLNSRQDRYRRCLIQVADPAACTHPDASFARAFPYDPEQVLLHELLHCIVPGEGAALEYAVETLSKTLLAMDRVRPPEAYIAASSFPVSLIDPAGTVLDPETLSPRVRPWVECGEMSYTSADPGPQA